LIVNREVRQMGSSVSSRSILPPRTSGTAARGPTRTNSSRQSSRVWTIERFLVRRILAAVGNPPIALELWNGEAFGHPAPRARVIIHDRRTFWQLLGNVHLGFGDAYSDGRVEIQGDLLEFLEIVYRSEDAEPANTFGTRSTKWLFRPQANTLGGSRANIHHHYDIGDEFYRHWLDRELVYTCAYFPSPDVSLEVAQEAKMELICRKLWLKPGETVVEAGCGWGALALYMARHYGVNVKAYNVSRDQIRYAREKAVREGLDSRVEFVEDDYRTIQGQFDVFASIGMLEHVGVDHYRQLGEVIHRCLRPAGRGILHTIGRDQPGCLNVWIERRIFPGAYPPSLHEITNVLEPRAFSVLDVENLRLHYALTLQHWLARFDAAEAAVQRMFDPSFVRAWRLYLAGSLAAFRTGALQLFQVLFARHGSNDIPWTRKRILE
jgi:cyclopropane-fatty-acyl-phospholipid synthase